MPRLRSPAVLALVGSILVCGAAGAQVSNPSFETGTLSGWTSSGFLINSGGPTVGGPQLSTFLAAESAGTPTAPSNAAESSQTSVFDGSGTPGPAIGPTSGSFLAFVSNEASGGDDTLTGSSISQTFTVPAGSTTLSVDVRLLNNDDSTDFVAFDDFGGVALTQGATVIGQFNLDLDPGSSGDRHVTANANAGGFRNSTGFATATFNVAGFVGQSITLTAYSLQYGGDNNIETRLLIDNVRFNGGDGVTTAVPVPTLSTSLLWGLGLLVAGAALLQLRRRSR